jgi:predicted MFS family arabinose efflux permease
VSRGRQEGSCSRDPGGVSRTPQRSPRTTAAVGARSTLLIVAGWGACLIPFAFAPRSITLVCFAFGGLVYGPFVPLSYALFQSATSTTNLPSLLAARSAVLIISTPLGTAVGGPIVDHLGAAKTLTASGAATVALAAAAAIAGDRRDRLAGCRLL